MISTSAGFLGKTGRYGDLKSWLLFLLRGWR